MQLWKPDPEYYRPTLRVPNLAARGGLRRRHLHAVLDARERIERGFDPEEPSLYETPTVRMWVEHLVREHWGLLVLAALGLVWTVIFVLGGWVWVPGR